MGFFGKESVLRTHAKQPKKTTSQHHRRTSGDTFATAVPFSSYVYPIKENAGLADQSANIQTTTIVLYQLGQTYAPSAEDKITDSTGLVWQIDSINSRLNADTGYAVHDCVVYRMS